MRAQLDAAPTNEQPKRHFIFTCFDNRIDGIVQQEVEKIRSAGGIIVEKCINRLPGGVHLLTEKTCRNAFYYSLSTLSDEGIAGIDVFHVWPHTVCKFCGIHHKEKIGTGVQSDLRFHLRSAEKIHSGAHAHFATLPIGEQPELDVRIILTIDQKIVTIEEANELLLTIPPHHGHGHPCCRPDGKASMFCSTPNGGAIGRF